MGYLIGNKSARSDILSKHVPVMLSLGESISLPSLNLGVILIQVRGVWGERTKALKSKRMGSIYVVLGDSPFSATKPTCWMWA